MIINWSSRNLSIVRSLDVFVFKVFQFGFAILLIMLRDEAIPIAYFLFDKANSMQKQLRVRFVID